jgi:carboxymethylenebutenolidase
MAMDVPLQVGSDPMKLYVATPDQEPRGAVMVLQEAFGVNDHIRDICQRFAAVGYLAAAPHLFHRSGAPELGYEDMQEVMPFMMQLQADQIEADIEAALEHLSSIGFETQRVAAIGFCMGGSIAFVAGCYWRLGAAVSFYGGGISQSRFGLPPLIDLAPTLQSPYLGLFGDLDGSIPIGDVEGLRSAVETAAPEAEIVRYPDANHGFHCDARSSYHEASAKDAWQRTLAFLEEHLS